MSRVSDAKPRWWRLCAAGLLALAECSQLPTTSSVVMPPIAPGAGRVWLYRNDYQYEAHQTPYVMLNGQIVGVVQPNGAFYRDVPPGHYTVVVDSYGVPYPNQFAEFNLGAGQEAFIKVLSMRDVVGGEFGVGTRARFFTQLFPADAARAAIAGTPFYGSS
jgi:uncharacterized protein DUF2846